MQFSPVFSLCHAAWFGFDTRMKFFPRFRVILENENFLCNFWRLAVRHFFFRWYTVFFIVIRPGYTAMQKIVTECDRVSVNSAWSMRGKTPLCSWGKTPPGFYHVSQKIYLFSCTATLKLYKSQYLVISMNYMTFFCVTLLGLAK